MKNTGKCPKCESKDLIKVPGSVGNAYGRGDNTIASGGWLGGSIVYVTRYVCMDCGFTEEWIEKPGDRQKLKEKFG